METPARQVKCPLCGRLTFYTPENPSRPFCSERCKLTDLGQWAEGKYAIPSEEKIGIADNEAFHKDEESD
jgi:hypothetical protein